MKTNYSVETSLPAYHSNQPEKALQADRVLELIKRGADNILKLSLITGLESGRISARVNDLIKDGKVMYSGFTVFQNRTRKKILVVVSGEQVKMDF